MSLGLFAQHISIEDAQEVAESFFCAKTTRSTASVELAYIAESQDQTGESDLYVFNNKSGGYAIVSADERATDILVGYSNVGKFSYENVPENMKWWLSEYVRQIDYLRANVKETDRKRSFLKASSTKIVVAPLLGNTKWNQEEPYNRLTPQNGNVKAATGCVATAMAQIMYYHKWPKVGVGQHTNSNDASLTVDFSQSVYQWDKMRDTYGSTYTDEEANAVAKLMYDCGIAVDMQYGHDGSSSGAFSEDVAPALKTYFDYSTEITYLERNNSTTNWDDILMDELNNLRPVYYSGSDKDAGGHAFVCDGYEDKDGKYLFHINWGWGGSYDGYFVSSLLDMTSSMSFKYDQDITYKIHANSKVKSGSLYYNILSDESAQVTAPNSKDEYTGTINIPSSVTIDGKTYSVVSINSYAFGGCTGLTEVSIPTSVRQISGNIFFGCSGLKNIIVNWTDDIPEVPLHFCDEDAWINTTLTVPAGYLDKYSTILPWMCFCHIKDTTGKSIDYTAWEPFEGGTGTYTYTVNYSTEDENLPIYISTNQEDTDKARLRIDNWGYLYSSGEGFLFMNYDKSTHNCTVPAQYITDVSYYLDADAGTVATEAFYISDIPSYDSSCDYDSYPCTYEPATGLFTLNVIYYTPTQTFGNGVETFKMDGDYKDMSVSIESPSAIKENTDMSATQKFNLTGGADVAKFKYSLQEGKLSSSQIKAVAQGIADGSIESKTKSNGMMNMITITYPQPGKYTLVIISVDAEDAYYGQYVSYEINYVYSKQWKSIAKGRYTESVLSDMFNGFDQCTYEVELEQHITEPGRIRMKNPYGTNYPYNSDGSFSTTTTDTYIEINITDPDGVYIPMDQSMNISIASYGDCHIGSLAAYYMEEGEASLEDVKAKGYCGTLKDGYITFPTVTISQGEEAGTLLLRLPNYSDGWYYAGPKFQLDIRDWYYTGLEDLTVSSQKTAQSGVYDLSGRKVADSLSESTLSSGVYIVNGKKYLKR